MTTENNLTVSETFYSIQGEGQTIGTPAVFLRLTGCNLNCDWCDSVEVWRKGEKKVFKDVLDESHISRLQQGAHLIFTGGEPMLYQGKIFDYISWFISVFGFKPKIEIETNGTIAPTREMVEFVNYWNISPKLSNAREPINKRKIEDALVQFGRLRPESLIYKFVIDEEEDFQEVLSEWSGLIDMNRAYLMPAGDCRRVLDKKYEKIASLAIRLGLRFTPRVHINIWDKKTGV